MRIENGKPVIEGLYVVFVPAVVKDWLEPHIVTWHKGAWYFRWSTEKYDSDVKGWCGPIPTLKNTGTVTRHKIGQEYDL